MKEDFAFDCKRADLQLCLHKIDKNQITKLSWLSVCGLCSNSSH